MVLSEIMKREYGLAKVWGRILGCAQWLALGIGVGGLLWPQDITATLVAAVAAATPFIVVLLREVAGRYYSAGERLRC